MSLLAHLRIPQLCSAKPRFCATVAQFSSSTTRSARPSQPSPARPNSVKSTSFADSIFDAITGVSAHEPEDLPPTAPPGGYPKPNPPQPNFIRDQRQQGEMEAGNEEAAETRLETRQLYRMYVKTTRNNIIITFTRPNGDPIRTHTGGACGFKHVNRSTHEAAHQCAVKMFKTIQEGILPKDPKMKLHVFVSGFGKGRDAVKQAFMGTEGDALRPLVVRLTDKTPIKIGGVRAKKVRRV